MDDGRLLEAADLEDLEYSVAMTETLDAELAAHLDKGPDQEDLAFALWRPSLGRTRMTAILQRAVLPQDDERIQQGNVAFTVEYVRRVLEIAEGTGGADDGYGIALLHSHLGPGWQDMSDDDEIAERERLAGAVAGRTGLPLVGLTRGTDGAWSGRFWVREGRWSYGRRWAATVRVVGQRLRITYHPALRPAPPVSSTQVATVSVWGEEAQADLARVHAGIVGVGSVGSIVAEALSRVGMTWIAPLDHDDIENRNLDRTAGARREDVSNATPKVRVAERHIEETHTAASVHVEPFEGTLLSEEGLARALDCDILFSCVDRPWPRHLLNAIAYAHLIPVIDGGIFARVHEGRLLHADWRIQIAGPTRQCLVCSGALRPEDIALDRAGKLDDPSYIKGLGPEFDPLLARQNVFPFSLSVAAHEVLQFVGLVTGQRRVGGAGAQVYHCYPGTMEVHEGVCRPECAYSALLAAAADLRGNLLPDAYTPA
jgi:hypothetical protein